MDLDYANYFDDVWQSKNLEPTPEKLEEVKEKGYLFIHNPRTAGSSIREALSETNSEHIPARAYKKLFTPSPHFLHIWNSFFKFAIVRNPYDRFASTYAGVSGISLEQSGVGMNEYLDGNLEVFLKAHEVMLKPQYYFLCDTKGKILVDYLGQFKDLNLSWRIISNKIENKENLQAPRSKEEPQELNEKHKDIVFKLYQKDFEIFGYSR